LYKNSVIRHFFAGFLLLVFSFSITPRQILHDVLVNHKDSYPVHHSGHDLKLTQSGFQCDINKQVVELPFLYEPDFQLVHPGILHTSVASFYLQILALPAIQAGIYKIIKR